MKELWKKFDRFMLKYGGYALLIATVATAGFFAVLQWANDYLAKETTPLSVSLDKDGSLSVNYQYDDKEKVYIYWETDAGNISAKEGGDIFENEQQNGYFVYTKSDGLVSWSPEDADGLTYSEATVRAVLYERNDENIYEIKNYVMELTVTVSYQDGKIAKAEDRVFSNPVRENADESWEQIYVFREDENTAELRYRTGRKIDTENETMILCWMSGNDVLSEVDYSMGMLPVCTINKELENQNLLKASIVVSVKKSDSNQEIYAGLINEEVYRQEKIDKKDIDALAVWSSNKK